MAAATQPAYLDVNYTTIAREERATSTKRRDESVAKVKFCLIVSTIRREIGVFPLSQMRLMLGSEHPHYLYIKKYLVNADEQADDEDDSSWNPETQSKSFTGVDGLEYEKFKAWASKFRGATSITQFL